MKNGTVMNPSVRLEPPQVARVVKAMAGHDAIECVTLTGSRVTGFASRESDMDLFVYVRDTEGLRSIRSVLAAEWADTGAAIVLGQPGHPNTDVWVLRGTGVWMDIMFWSCRWAEEELDWRLLECSPKPGYTTCFWRSIRDGFPLFERTRWHGDLQKRARAPYPEILRTRIIELNAALMGSENPFSFLNQMRKAVDAADLVAVQHRTAAWLACYFDLLFAANRVLHPGEKRLIAFAERECERVPERFGQDVLELVQRAANLDPGPVGSAGRMLDRLGDAGLLDFRVS